MISITIPVYEMNGAGSRFLEQSLNYISNQKYREFEVVISDHSINDDLKNICDKFNFLDINYIRNENYRGSSSSNMNNAILNTKYNIIKFLMQDEFLYDPFLLGEISNCFSDPDVKWIANSCINGPDVDNPLYTIVPRYNQDIIKGNNTIGSPSCISIRKTEDMEMFNPDLIWLMDCDYYKRVYDKWGDPMILPKNYVFITHHPDQLTNLIPPEKKEYEHKLLLQKY
jgi:glycosyltransferase involved in cell wall biosynthesis